MHSSVFAAVFWVIGLWAGFHAQPAARAEGEPAAAVETPGAPEDEADVDDDVVK